MGKSVFLHSASAAPGQAGFFSPFHFLVTFPGCTGRVTAPCPPGFSFLYQRRNADDPKL